LLFSSIGSTQDSIKSLQFHYHSDLPRCKYLLNQARSSPPQLFKGIALFTPKGDLIYCIDPNKQKRWHLHLCVALQEILGLPEPPHFLVPCYTATIDRWFDPQTKQLRVFAEAYPPVLRHQVLLNALFETKHLVWQPVPIAEGLCDPMVLAAYRRQFPQLWESHELVVRFDQNFSRWDNAASGRSLQEPDATTATSEPTAQGYVLRLFVSGHSTATEHTLQTLHQLLETSLHHPYTLKVIDILKHPEQAETDQVSATPTLVRVWPRPVRRIVGELDNVSRLLQALAVPEA
jgi:circadian clock protein KaiB